MPSDPSSPLSGPVREPKQNRSRASFEKVIAAARTLLAQRGYESFTLNDVVKESGVSIGSIYGRVSGKDDLLRVVQQRMLEEMAVEENALLSPDRWVDAPLAQMLPVLIDGLAEMLNRHSPHLKPFMHRAATDEAIRDAGRASGLRMARLFQDVLLMRRDEIRHPDPERAAYACFTAAYSCFSRFLGLGTSPDAAGEGDWRILKEDVLMICASYLQFAEDVQVAALPSVAPQAKRRVKAGSSRA